MGAAAARRQFALSARVYSALMSATRSWLKQKLPPATIDRLRSMRHASSQALTGADMYHLRVELERRIELRLRETEVVLDERIIAAFREELTSELDRWGQDMMDRMDILLGATNRLIASLESRVAELERPVPSAAENGAGNP